MLFYSHLVFAQFLREKLVITNEDSYYFGSVFPDVRYHAKVPRTYTHINSGKIVDYLTEFPGQKNFLAGYYFHCVLDELDVPGMISENFSVKLLQTMVPPKIKTVLLEYFFREKFPDYTPVKPLENEITMDLGIQSSTISEYIALLNSYMDTSSLKEIVAYLEKLGLTRFGSVEKYLSAAEFLEHHKHTRHMLFKALDLDKLKDMVLKKITDEGYFEKISRAGILKLKKV